MGKIGMSRNGLSWYVSNLCLWRVHFVSPVSRLLALLAKGFTCS